MIKHIIGYYSEKQYYQHCPWCHDVTIPPWFCTCQIILDKFIWVGFEVLKLIVLMCISSLLVITYIATCTFDLFHSSTLTDCNDVVPRCNSRIISITLNWNSYSVLIEEFQAHWFELCKKFSSISNQWIVDCYFKLMWFCLNWYWKLQAL